VAAAVLLPWAAGIGPAGVTLVRAAAPNLGQTRAYMGLDSQSSFVPPRQASPGVAPNAGKPVEPDPGNKGGPLRIANRKLPRTTIDGRTYRVLRDPNTGRVYLIGDSQWSNLTHLPAGVSATLFRPLIGEHTWSWRARLASVENLLWYGLYGLGLYGVWAAGRDRWRVLAFPVAVSALLVGESALSQGNLGSAFRHRGQLLWILALLGGVALERLSHNRRRSRFVHA
jgi:hypothetical protein